MSVIRGAAVLSKFKNRDQISEPIRREKVKWLDLSSETVKTKAVRSLTLDKVWLATRPVLLKQVNGSPQGEWNFFKGERKNRTEWRVNEFFVVKFLHHLLFHSKYWDNLFVLLYFWFVIALMLIAISNTHFYLL